METYLLDTNILIRFLKQDHRTMGPATEDLFQAAARGEVRLIIEESILAEAVYVLRHPQVDFADALLAASAADQEIPVASFDRDFDRFGDVVRFNPPSV